MSTDTLERLLTQYDNEHATYKGLLQTLSLTAATGAAGAAGAAGTGAGASTLTSIITSQANLNALYTQIQNELEALGPLVDQNKASNNSIRQTIGINAPSLQARILNMQNKFAELKTELDKPIELEGNYQIAQTSMKSNFIKYILYLFFAIFVLGCLCLLYLYPSIEYLDTFIMALAAIVIIYYTYDYFQRQHVQ